MSEPETPANREALFTAIMIVVTGIISVVMAEVMLRLFTPFPITTMSHQAPHDVLGYVIDQSFNGIDEFGFPNPPGKHKDYRYAVLGDSHTFGQGVPRDATWVQVLENTTGHRAYNFGVSSYDIPAYLYTADLALKAGAETIIIGLYVSNDFVKFCGRTTDDFWRQMVAELGEEARCTEADRDIDYEIAFGGTKSWLKRFALISFLDYYVYDPYVKQEQQNYFALEDGVVNFYGDYGRLTRRSEQNTGQDIEPFMKILTLAQQRATESGAAFGMVMLPSEEAVGYAWAHRKGVPVADSFTEIGAADQAFRNKVFAACEQHSIVCTDALPDMVDAYDAAFEAGDVHDVYVPWDNHPMEAGHQAYARAALRLLERIED